MNKPATHIAPPPARGGKLPEFEELLASGSFHARLAKARIQREEALARAAEAGEDDAALLKRCKPWETEGDGAEVPDRAIQALDDALVLKRPGLVLPLGAPAESPAPKPEPVAQLPVPVPVPQTAVAVVASRPSRSRAILAGGFAAGLVIGAALVALIPALRGGPPPSGIATPSAAPAEIVTAPAVEAAVPTEATPVALLPPAETPAAILPPSQLATDLSRQGAALGSSETAPITVAPARVVGRLSATPAPLAGPHAADDRALPTLEPSQARPSVGDGVTALATLALTGSGAPDGEVGAWPAVRSHSAPDIFLPVALRADAPVARPPLPMPYIAPRPRPAHLAPRDSAPDAIAEPLAAPATRFPHRILLHAPSSVSDTALGGVLARIESAGFAAGDPRRVDIVISRSNVRYFHAEDSRAAALLAGEIGARVRDFSNYTPAPPPGTIEVWLAGRGGGTAAPDAPRAKATQRQQQTARDQELLFLRRLIIRQLRNGEQL